MTLNERVKLELDEEEVVELQTTTVDRMLHLRNEIKDGIVDETNGNCELSLLTHILTKLKIITNTHAQTNRN